MSPWTLVIPVKGNSLSKSRLGGSAQWRASIAHAMALDSVEAALAAVLVVEVIVVTSGDRAIDFETLGARVIAQPGEGLDAAVSLGLSVASAPSAVLLGDVPALQPAELDAALTLAAGSELSVVTDSDGSGTVLLASRSGAHAPAFGEGSAARHRAAGYVELPVAAASGLRCDVDTVEQLRALGDRVGARTAALAT